MINYVYECVSTSKRTGCWESVVAYWPSLDVWMSDAPYDGESRPISDVE